MRWKLRRTALLMPISIAMLAKVIGTTPKCSVGGCVGSRETSFAMRFGAENAASDG